MGHKGIVLKKTIPQSTRKEKERTGKTRTPSQYRTIYNAYLNHIVETSAKLVLDTPLPNEIQSKNYIIELNNKVKYPTSCFTIRWNTTNIF